MLSIPYGSADAASVFEGTQALVVYGAWALVLLASAMAVPLGVTGLLRGRGRLQAAGAVILALPPFLLGLFIFLALLAA